MRSPAPPGSLACSSNQWAAVFAALLLNQALARRAVAQTSGVPSVAPAAALPASPRPATLPPLAAVPRLQLVPPGTAAITLQREQPFRLGYWQDAMVPGQWRHSSDAELRLQLPVARLELGRWAFSSQIETVPGRERDCVPDCRAPAWSSSVRLKYEAGDVGPLRQTGPELELKGARPPVPGPQRGFLGAGFGGKF